MPYISRIYKDTNNLEDYFNESIHEACKDEMKKGNIPVNARFQKRSLQFYVSRDVCIDTIRTFLQEVFFCPSVSFKKVIVFELDKELQEYRTVLPIVSFSQELEQQFGSKKIMLAFSPFQQDPEIHPDE